MTTDSFARAAVRPVAFSDPRPLTEAQAGLWYAQHLDPLNPVFNTAQCVEIDGPLDVARFRAAVRDAMREADALAIRVIDAADGPRQIADERQRATLVIIDLRSEQDPRGAAEARMQQDLREPLDPAVDPLAAQRLFVLEDEWFVWYQRLHHLVIDGYGTALLTARIADLYSARVTEGRETTQPFGAYGDLLDADAAYRTSPRRVADRTWWESQFAGAPPVAGLASGSALTGHSYRRCGLDLSANSGRALQQVAAAADVPWPDVITALVAAYVSRHGGVEEGGVEGEGSVAREGSVAGEADVEGEAGVERDSAAAGGARETTVGMAVMERLGTPAARVPAMVMNVLPVRVPIDDDRPLVEWLQIASRTMKEARRRGRYRSEQLRRDLGLLGGHRRLHGPLVNILPFDEPPRLAGLRATLRVLATGPVDDLTVTVRADARLDRVRAELDANPALYTDEAVAAHAARLASFIERALSCERLSAVPTLTPREYERWVVEVNDTTTPVEDTTLAELMARSIARRPDAPAVAFGDRVLSYRDLDARTAHLARALRARGVRRGDIVAVAIQRSIELVVSLCAILRIGGAYLPLDLDQPPARLSQMLRLARPRGVISATSVSSHLPDDAEVYDVALLADAAPERDEDSEATDAATADSANDGEDANSGPRPEDAAYVIFTSGSTGEPKAVVIQHRALVNRLEWMRSHYGIGAADRILQKTPATFDVSVWEFFLPLIAGGTLVVAPPDAHKDPRALALLMREQRISVVHFVPSMLAEFLSEPAAANTGACIVFCSGEALPAALRDRVHALLRVELHNLYGPTEAAVDVTWWPASADDRSDPVPIGRPVWNTRLYVLDDRGRPLPPGVAGHLFISGVQLAREYLGRPDLTVERFVPDPFGTPGDRMYRTGDIARWRADGAIEFLGRADHQVKIRGQRIELGEIEAAILATGRVARAVVVAREEAPGDHRLVAYVEPAGDSRSASPDLDAGAPPARDDDGVAPPRKASNPRANLVASPGANHGMDPRVDPGPDLAEALAADLGARLPAVMVPQAFVRVDEWPTTANGKLDRRRLPAPHALRRRGRAASTPSETLIASLFADVLALDIGDVRAESDFFALGGHSLLATQLVRRLRATVDLGEGGDDVSLGAIFAHPTVARLASHLDRTRSTDSREATATDEGLDVLLTLAAIETRLAPVICVHPAGGIAWCYGHLARALDPPRPVYGLQARGLRSGGPQPATLDDLADDYLAEVRRVQPSGPYHLAGWSVGGIIAQAMAARLERMGERVGLLAMLDAYPSDRWRSATDPDEAAALRALLLMAGEDPDAVDVPLTRADVIDRLRRGQHPLGALSNDALSGVLRVVEHNNRLVRRHRHTPCAAPLIHFRAALDHGGDGARADEWGPYVGGVERIDVPSRHAHMTGPEMSRLIASILSERLS